MAAKSNRATKQDDNMRNVLQYVSRHQSESAKFFHKKGPSK